ncbi:hypothetical protein T265_03392 [Opisthorchis viverrini]|uniref:Uncharacterized protein n=1 Tax=Opisthorchis viverrini TaxID=6198 RepID=A0A074ZSP6_OPIVI|nr:hypothetical protein T265_03392 [Opisthorchis viverrini]KER30131.1 hypothetical protein T265_03392 [Opisthorchis viverrini]
MIYQMLVTFQRWMEGERQIPWLENGVMILYVVTIPELYDDISVPQWNAPEPSLNKVIGR